MDLADLMPCGHPKGCMVSSETSACGWCAEVALRVTANKRANRREEAYYKLEVERDKLCDALRELHDFAEPSTHHRYQDRSKKAVESAAALLKETETE